MNTYAFHSLDLLIRQETDIGSFCNSNTKIPNIEGISITIECRARFELQKYS
jgi:hypothetical protein